MGTAGWGFEPGANNSITTQPSMDSTIGTGLSIVSSGVVWVGHDQYVRDNAGVGPPRTYKGVPTTPNEPFQIEEFTRGLVDIYEVWLYTPGGAQAVQIVFKGI